MSSVAERVSNGSAWLDEHYPGWWKSIDLATLELASCHSCVLGQVYTGHVPARERHQMLGQVLSRMRSRSVAVARTFAESINAGESGGFNVIYELHGLANRSLELGFSIQRGYCARGSDTEYMLLTDEWTRVIISRRMADVPELVGAR